MMIAKYALWVYYRSTVYNVPEISCQDRCRSYEPSCYLHWSSLVSKKMFRLRFPENLRRSSEILERVEMLTREEPVNIASIIRQWLSEPASTNNAERNTDKCLKTGHLCYIIRKRVRSYRLTVPI